MTTVKGRRWASQFLGLMFALVTISCTERALVLDTEGAEPRPPAGTLFGECAQATDCDGDAPCLRPSGELGFCTKTCTTPMACGVFGDDPNTRCIVIDQDEAAVCALDCEMASCPGGMRCERVDTPSGARSLCF